MSLQSIQLCRVALDFTSRTSLAHSWLLSYSLSMMQVSSHSELFLGVLS